ncbi:MAG: hypothetical protein ACYDB1_12555 [Acidiferrobacteraceae bacterium]
MTMGKQLRRRVLLLIAGLLPLTAAAAPAQGLPRQFAFQYAVGQQFVYRDTGRASGLGGPEKNTGQTTISITSHDAAGWRAVEVYSAQGGRRYTHELSISNSGVWRHVPSGVVVPNRISFDPRTLCLPRKALALHLSWSCSPLGNFVRGPGHERITVTKISPSAVTLDVVGATGVQRSLQNAPGGRPGTASVLTRSTWHDIITFVNGRDVQTVEVETHSTDMPGITTIGTTVVHNEYTAIRR